MTRDQVGHFMSEKETKRFDSFSKQVILSLYSKQGQNMKLFKIGSLVILTQHTCSGEKIEILCKVVNPSYRGQLCCHRLTVAQEVIGYHQVGQTLFGWPDNIKAAPATN